jgi:hypothetical protein
VRGAGITICGFAVVEAPLLVLEKEFSMVSGASTVVVPSLAELDGDELLCTAASVTVASVGSSPIATL